MRIIYLLLSAVAACPDQGWAGSGEPSAAPETETRVLVSPSQLFALATEARARGDARTAESAYRALASNPDLQIRSEARFRLGMMAGAAGRPTEAAILFRQILDEQPKAQRVRLELAQILDQLGDESGARRALREVQAGGLPADVARFVDRYSAALRAQKPFEVTIEAAIAPDSNLNRATRSETLGTVIGDFALDRDARQRSGIGMALRTQAQGRVDLGGGARLVGRVSSSANFYRDKRFNDLAIGVSAGPEVQLGRDRLAIEAGVARHSFGGKPLALTATLSGSYLHPLGRVSQIRVAASASRIDHKLNRLQDGTSYSLSVAYERALSATTGIGASLALDRQALRDPGYASKGGQLSIFGYHEFGATTLVASLGHGRLEGDERLFIYPERRRDRLYRASLGATFRQLEFGGFAPFARVTREVNRSSIEIYGYERTRTEFGFTRAF